MTVQHASGESACPFPRLRFPSRDGGERGQSTVEIVGLLPLVALIALVAFTVVASSTAQEQAGEAAAAGALALLQGGADPRAAAREALPRDVRARAAITVSGRRVHVRVVPRTPLPFRSLRDRLAGTAHADAGPSAP
jgi:hypothetical protein